LDDCWRRALLALRAVNENGDWDDFLTFRRANAIENCMVYRSKPIGLSKWNDLKPTEFSHTRFISATALPPKSDCCHAMRQHCKKSGVSNV